ncbi:hypothetical protein DRF65_13070 [Chryseobacterium pennae]|uniref:Uncharacterized protein n=1 Tax=Chryseobacterium pennae TaxID=2258962 RepID=A0A3D9C8Y3_9FLAO|nr:hypothetical protein DRF65_13070 [Chryseobacterium pennae]
MNTTAKTMKTNKRTTVIVIWLLFLNKRTYEKNLGIGRQEGRRGRWEVTIQPTLSFSLQYKMTNKSLN